ATRLIEAQTPIQGMSDHGTHEAIYLPDADGNGIELAADRPRDRWIDFSEEFARGGPAPLDLRALLGTIIWRWPTTRGGCASETSTCPSATSRKRSPSTATCSASSSGRTWDPRHSCRPAATTTTW